VAEEPIVDRNPKLKLTSDVPGLVVREAPLTVEDIPNIENIGGGPYKVRTLLTSSGNRASEVQLEHKVSTPKCDTCFSLGTWEGVVQKIY
jgi:hypothetical protein